jgi:hypothetical protein
MPQLASDELLFHNPIREDLPTLREETEWLPPVILALIGFHGGGLLILLPDSNIRTERFSRVLFALGFPVAVTYS